MPHARSAGATAPPTAASIRRTTSPTTSPASLPRLCSRTRRTSSRRSRCSRLAPAARRGPRRRLTLSSERAARSPIPLNPAGFEPRIPRAPNSGLFVPCVSFPRNMRTCAPSWTRPRAASRRLLRQLDVLTVNISPACMQLSGKEKQLVQKTLNDLSETSASAYPSSSRRRTRRATWQQQPFKRTTVAIGHDASSKLLACSRPCTSSSRPATTS